MMPTLLLLTLLGAAPAPTANPLERHRFALIVGANQGGSGRELRHAISDAQGFAGVLATLGGVRAGDSWMLQNPSVTALRETFQEVAAHLGEERERGAPVEFVFYYSGHSDEAGLLLKGEHYGYRALHQDFQGVPADFRVAILDSCSSGTFTHTKGGAWASPFLSDASRHVTGEAILTSSSASEVSQESDRLGGSFFTRNLITGLRGAADSSRDGRVTLAEAYQFAFDETLARTERTQLGAQHPAYEMAVEGVGDLVMTDLHQRVAVLVLGQALVGRVFVRDPGGHLVVELNKRLPGPLELGLEAGHYSVTLAEPGKVSLAQAEVNEGARTVLQPGSFVPVAAEVARARGDVDATLSPEEEDHHAWRAEALLYGNGLHAVGSPNLLDTNDLNLRATYYTTPLEDDLTRPLAALLFLQHPSSISLEGVHISSSQPSFGLSAHVYPWSHTGLEALATVGRSAYGDQFIITMEAGVDHYFASHVRASVNAGFSNGTNPTELGSASSLRRYGGTAELQWLIPSEVLLLTAHFELRDSSWSQLSLTDGHIHDREGSENVTDGWVSATCMPNRWLALGGQLGLGTDSFSDKADATSTQPARNLQMQGRALLLGVSSQVFPVPWLGVSASYRAIINKGLASDVASEVTGSVVIRI